MIVAALLASFPAIEIKIDRAIAEFLKPQVSAIHTGIYSAEAP
jgi:hypothetical protein